MIINSVLNIKKGSITSIVGAGGKTTLMFSLAEELKAENKVLVTTTTKIYVPESSQFDFFHIGNEFNKHSNNGNGIYVYGSAVNEEGKIAGLNCEAIEKLQPYFDFILVEADGAKRKPIKGWNSNEPVICEKTDNTIGVLSVEVIGKEICEENVHRVEEFVKITNSKCGELINIKHLMYLIFNKKGLFKNSKGYKILFINKVGNHKEVLLARKLLNSISRENNGYIDKVVIGKLSNVKKIVAHCTLKGRNL